jgi:PAS domain-containing protein
LALDRSCNTLTQVRRATLDNLFEGVAAYGSDGRLKLHNPAYLKIWGLSQDDVAGGPHIGEIVDRMRVFLDDRADWAATKQKVIAEITAHAAASSPLYHSDGSMLQVATVPLPDGNVLTSLDVTDMARVERALPERNETLETAGQLKSEFIANVSHDVAHVTERSHRLCRDSGEPVISGLSMSASSTTVTTSSGARACC